VAGKRVAAGVVPIIFTSGAIMAEYAAEIYQKTISKHDRDRHQSASTIRAESSLP